MSTRAEALRDAAARGYMVLADGTPIGVRRHVLRTHVSADGYHHIGVKCIGGVRPVSVARLQAYQKFGDRIFNPDISVRHLDGNPGNNRVTNITIGSRSDNMLDKPRSTRLRAARQAAQAQRRFTDTEVADMRERRRTGTSLRILCELYGISKGHMSDIVNNKIYTYTTSEIFTQ